MRSYTAPPLPGVETLLRRLLDPWLDGAGGLAQDAVDGGWTATTTPIGHARLESLLSALGDPRPRAPHLPPTPGLDGFPPLARAPRGNDLAAWALDLAGLAGFAVALGPDLDPSGPPPVGEPGHLTEAIAALAAGGIRAGLVRGCLCLGVAEPIDRLHPAERTVVAILPVVHLCTDDVAVERLAMRLADTVLPAAWRQPGWAIAALPWRRDLLVVGDPPAIHAVMHALERIDRGSLQP